MLPTCVHDCTANQLVRFKILRLARRCCRHSTCVHFYVWLLRVSLAHAENCPSSELTARTPFAPCSHWSVSAHTTSCQRCYQGKRLTRSSHTKTRLEARGKISTCITQFTFTISSQINAISKPIKLPSTIHFIIDWPPRAPDMNPIENMRSEVKRTTQETWPVLPPRNSDELWVLVSDAWDEVASSQHYIQSLTESMTGRMKSMVEAEGFWTSY
jgi:hypothetical protein